MASNYTIHITLLIGSLLSISQYAGEEKYPHDALTKTWIPIKLSDNGHDLKTMQNRLKAVIDASLDPNYSDEAKKPEFKWHSYVTSYFTNFLVWVGIMNLPVKTKLKVDEFDMRTYADLYNRVSQTLRKKAPEFSYTLFEAAFLAQRTPQLGMWYKSHASLIEKIKNNTVNIASAEDSTKIGEEVFCLRKDDIPAEISDLISRNIYCINNKPVQYRTVHGYGSFSEKIFYPQDSFDGLSVEISAGTQIPLLATELTPGDMVYPTTQVWFKDTVDGIRLSDDYNFIDIHCSMPSAAKLVGAEFSDNYLVALYKQASNDDDLWETETGTMVINVFKWPKTKKRIYEKIIYKNRSRGGNKESIRVKKYNDWGAELVFSTSEADGSAVHLVGMDKKNERFVYQVEDVKANTKTLYESKLVPGDATPQEILLPDMLQNKTIKKMVCPTQFISIFLTAEREVWARIYKASINPNKMEHQRVFNYEWVRLDTKNDEIEDIAIEQWQESGRFGVAFMTKNKKLICEQYPNDTAAFLKAYTVFDPVCCHTLVNQDTCRRLYVHGKKATLLCKNGNGGDFFIELPMAWNK